MDIEYGNWYLVQTTGLYTDIAGKAVESLLEGLTPGLQTEPEMLARFRDANILVLRLVFFFGPLNPPLHPYRRLEGPRFSLSCLYL